MSCMSHYAFWQCTITIHCTNLPHVQYTCTLVHSCACIHYNKVYHSIILWSQVWYFNTSFLFVISVIFIYSFFFVIELFFWHGHGQFKNINIQFMYMLFSLYLPKIEFSCLPLSYYNLHIPTINCPHSILLKNVLQSSYTKFYFIIFFHF